MFPTVQDLFGWAPPLDTHSVFVALGLCGAGVVFLIESRRRPGPEVLAGHSPTSKRASVVLPEADGPTTTSTSPGDKPKLTPFRIGCCVPGAAAITLSTITIPRGCGNGMPAADFGTVASKPSSRAYAPRTFTTACH